MMAGFFGGATNINATEPLEYNDETQELSIVLGEPGGVATLDETGKLSSDQIPALTITDTHVVANEAAMLALVAQTGDVAVRTDVSKSFILTASPATTLGNWQELLTPPDYVNTHVTTSHTRTTVTVSTGSLAAGASYTSTAVLGKAFRLLAVNADTACRVRLYGTTAGRDADVTRATDIEPSPTMPLVVDYLVPASATGINLQVSVAGASLEATPSSNIGVTVTNTSGSTATISVTLTFIKMEA